MFGYFPWYVRDYLSGTARGTLIMAQKGLYLDLLSIAWERGPSRDESPPLLPEAPKQLARLCHLPLSDFEPLWNGTQEYFTSDGEGHLYNPRQMREYEKCKALVEAKRAAGRKGGRAKAKASRAKQTLSSAKAEPKQKVADPSYPDSDSHPDSNLSSTSGSSSQRTSQDSLTTLGSRARESPTDFRDQPEEWEDAYAELAHGMQEAGMKLNPFQIEPILTAILPHVSDNGGLLKAARTIPGLLKARNKGASYLVAAAKQGWMEGCLRELRGQRQRETEKERMDRLEQELRDEGVEL